VRGIFIAIFIICLFVEMSHPGASIPGLIAIIALFFAIAPSMMLGLASWWEVGAIVLGVALLAVEVFVLPGFGVAGISGLILLFVGLLGTFIPAGSGIFPKGGQEQSQLLWGLASILAAFLTSGIAIYFIAKHLGSVPVLHRFVLRDTGTDEESAEWASTNLADADAPARVGEVGTAITPLRPSGKVDVGGRVIDASAEVGWVEPGAKVKVVSVSGFRVGVERA
jgi:membrane-bound serine protease (ClpP class)